MNSLLPVLFQPKPDTIYNFDALQLLRLLPDESVNCCVTSPPYFGLRDYQTAQWEGGDPHCDHKIPASTLGGGSNKSNNGSFTANYKGKCGKCGARRIDKQIGLEETPQQYVDALVTVFRELRRVLRSDGTFWLNIGDSYSTHAAGKVDDPFATSGLAGTRTAAVARQVKVNQSNYRNSTLPEKNRMMIPARLAIALQDDGWYLRDEIVWHKPNPMPASVTDRTTTAHEMVYLLTKSPRYWYDAEAVAEPAVGAGGGDFMPALKVIQPEHGGESRSGKWARNSRPQEPTRNRRSVWTINPEPLSAAHFAVMPSKLVEICVLAGCPPKVCSACGAPYQRVVDGERALDTNRPQARRALALFEEKGLTDDHLKAMRAVGLADAGKALVTMNGAGKNIPEQQQLADEAKAALGGYYREFLFGKRSSNGWKPTCNCHAPHDSGIVIDPFMGAGTVALVAQRLNRHFIGSDLNPEYVRMATMRVQGRLDEYIAEQRGEPHTAYMFAEEGGVASTTPR